MNYDFWFLWFLGVLYGYVGAWFHYKILYKTLRLNRNILRCPKCWIANIHSFISLYIIVWILP
jgi:hypothetical protein